MVINSTEERIESIKKYGKEAQGRRELIKYLEGGKLTLKGMIKGNCYDCMGYFVDGKVDCEMPLCALYPLMSYRKGEKYRLRPVKNLTDEQKAELRVRLKRKHAV